MNNGDDTENLTEGTTKDLTENLSDRQLLLLLLERVNGLDARMTGLESDMLEVKNWIADRSRDTRPKLDAILAEIVAANQRGQRLETDMQRMQADMQRMQADMQRMEGEMQRMEAGRQRTETDIKQIRREMGFIREDMVRGRHEVGELAERVTELERQAA